MSEDRHTPPRRAALRTMIAAPLALAAGMSGPSQAAQRSNAADRDPAARLDALESRAGITELLHAYARANDRADEALLRACFWPESTHKHGRFDGTSTDFIDFALRIIRGLHYASHHISNISIDVNGDRAFSECYYLAHHRRPARDGSAEEDAFFEGRYLDLHERRGGEWRIIRRRGLSDLSMVMPAGTPYASWPAGHHSQRAPDDDYYVMRRALLDG